MRFESISGRRLSASQINAGIARFDANGKSGPHSPDGLLLHHILNHCIMHKIPFLLLYYPDGYMVDQMPMINAAGAVVGGQGTTASQKP